MANPHGSFIWYELLTTDTAAARRFYGGLLGWQASSHVGQPGYEILTHGEDGIAGLMPAPVGVAPVWLGYLGVEDVDATVAAIVADGGAVQMPARDLPRVGRIAMVADPDGAPFYVMRGASDRASTSFSPDAAGHCGWNELGAGDMDRALDFYARHFRWIRGQALPMGAMGSYQLMELEGRAFGAIMPRQGEAKPMWRFYFRVSAMNLAVQRLAEADGTLLHGPAEVPGGDHIAIGLDPQGAMFCLVGKPG